VSFWIVNGLVNFPLAKYKAYEDMTKLGCVFVFDDMIVACQKPNKILRNNFGLHCENGPALTYADGITEIYSLNGVVLDKKYVLTPAEQISPTDVVRETNVEVRRELLRKVGVERCLEGLGAKILESSGNYELLSVNLSDDIKNAKYLKMINPSIGVFHIEGVAPECNTVQEAINWRAGNMDNTWSPSILT